MNVLWIDLYEHISLDILLDTILTILWIDSDAVLFRG